MDPSRRPPEFNKWNYLWDLWDIWLEKQGLTPLQACLGFVLSWDEIERIVIGIDSLQQISKILEDVETSTLDVPATLACNDEELINPSRWGES